jgi:uncharacterized protein (TIGR00725 family)
MIQIGVIGAGQENEETNRIAFAVGVEIARAGAVLVCGGLGGVMAHAAKGAREHQGTTVGILPGSEKGAANPFIDITIPSDMGHARNALVVRAADVLIAVGGGYGTLSEIALALKIGKPVVGIRTWEIPGVVPAEDASHAVDLAQRAIRL